MNPQMLKRLNTRRPMPGEVRRKAAAVLIGALVLVVQACLSKSTPDTNTNSLPATVPNFKAATFTQPSKITNRYFPHTAGASASTPTRPKMASSPCLPRC